MKITFWEEWKEREGETRISLGDGKLLRVEHRWAVGTGLGSERGPLCSEKRGPGRGSCEALAEARAVGQGNL